MQSLKEFMREYLNSRIAQERKELANREPFRKKFYSAECMFDSRAGTVEMIESETLEALSELGEEGEAITSLRNPLVDADFRTKQRYLLKRTGDTWLIRNVDLPCQLCNGEKGRSDCWWCKGEGWLSTDRLNRLSREAQNNKEP